MAYTPLAALRRAKERAEKRAEQLAEQLANAEQIPQEDPYSDGTVIRFKRRFIDVKKWYSYCAIRLDGTWWLSGRTPGAHGWDSFVGWFAEGKVENLQVMEPGAWLLPDRPISEFGGMAQPARSEKTITVTEGQLLEFVVGFMEQVRAGDVPAEELRRLQEKSRMEAGAGRLRAVPAPDHGPSDFGGLLGVSRCAVSGCPEQWVRDEDRQWIPTESTCRNGAGCEYHLRGHLRGVVPVAPQGEQADLETADEVDDDPVDSCSICGGYHEASYECREDAQTSLSEATANREVCSIPGCGCSGYSHP